MQRMRISKTLASMRTETPYAESGGLETGESGALRPTILHKTIFLTLLHIFPEDSAIENLFPFVHIPKFLEVLLWPP